MPARSPTIADLLQSGRRPLFSFEFFPPKDEIQQRQLWQTIRELEALGPDFVSVTYGASGSTRDRTITVTEAIAQHTTLRSMAHLTCASQSRDQLRRVIGSYAAAGVRHVLTIRGDMPGGPRVPFEVHPEGLHNATELVAMVRELGSFCVGVAAFPEPHPERNDHDLDARILVEKARPEPASPSPSCSSPPRTTSRWSPGSGRWAATCRSSRASCRSPTCAS